MKTLTPTLTLLLALSLTHPALAADTAAWEALEEQAEAAELLEIEAHKAEIAKAAAPDAATARKKAGLIAGITDALRDYREWKKSHPDHKRIKREFRAINRRIHQEGTPEHQAIRRAAESCQTEPGSCGSVLAANLQAIYQSADLAQKDKKGLSISLVPRAHAAGFNAEACYSRNTEWAGEDFMALLMGGDRYCGISYFGAGLSYGIAWHLRICSGGDGKGSSAGLYASAAGIFGAGAGLTVGSNGVCQMLDFKFGVGGLAGIVIVDDPAFSEGASKGQ